MENYLSPESIKLIANLINDKNEDLKQHFATEIRMLKTTLQDTHQIASETREFAKKTNGRVTRVEDDIYGAVDKNGKTVKGREGIIFDLNKVKVWDWLYDDWKIPLLLALLFVAISIEESREFMMKIIDKII